MTFRAYSQNNEDILLWRALKHIKAGFYIDVGAYHPVDDSITKGFYEQGWRGINIEPQMKEFNLLRLDRPEDTNLNIVISQDTGERDFYQCANPGLSTLNPQIAASHKEKLGWDYRKESVQARTLQSICDEFCPGDIHFLKIDVEGAEEDVLRSVDLNKFRPWIIVVEATDPMTPDLSINSVNEILRKANYCPEYFDGLNNFFVANEHPELVESFTTPVNSFDEGFVQPSVFIAELRNRDSQNELIKSRAQEAEDRAAQAESRAQAEIDAILASTSWRLTLPLQVFKELLTGDQTFLDIKKSIFRRLTGFISARPRLAFFILNPLRRHPRLYRKITEIYKSEANRVDVLNTPLKPNELSAAARRVYRDLTGRTL